MSKKCSYEKCEEMIPSHGVRNYCDNNFKCYHAQQKIDATKARERRRLKRPEVLIDCAYRHCEDKFIRKGAKCYCNKTCRKLEQDLAKEEKDLLRPDNKINKRPPAWALVRGNISGSGRSDIISQEA